MPSPTLHKVISSENHTITLGPNKCHCGALILCPVSSTDLHVGDELLCIEGRVVCDLDMLFIENLLHTSTTLTLTVRSSRTVFAQTQAMMDTNKYIDQLTCPPPPSQSRLTDDMIDMLIVPAPLSKYMISNKIMLFTVCIIILIY